MTSFVRFAMAILIAIGVAAAVGRAVFLPDLARRAEPLRIRLLDAFHRSDPLAAETHSELARFDGRFARHPIATYLHVLPGAVFLALAPLQFSARVRARHIRLHRWSGRLLVAAAVVTACAGLFFALGSPYGGAGEAVIVGLVGALLLVAVTEAVVAIRRGQVARHREWMIRAFAVMLGISTVRVVGLPLDLWLTPAAVTRPDGFVLTLWIGWPLTLTAAEVWIRLTRSRGRRAAAPATAA